ncbi:MAG TPA: transglycosylase SLT domain-containing protein [Gammaproteobacteria bacterium]|nr:transglycosylase SLT domain-containing protein [Gammaproteobacteria bacterium]
MSNKWYYLAHEAYQYSPAESAGSIWNSIRAGLKLNHQADSARVQAEIQKILADKDKLYSILERSAPYIYFIHQETQIRSWPAEIALIPIIESEFNPNDRSKKGASGLWQLMPETARELGITVKSNYDGRRNVVSSTKAALNYFNDLKNSFKGNWYLAISAYNCGPGALASAIRRNGSSDFWNLSLPAETRVYLPRLLAVAAIIKNPEKYGVQLPPIKNKPYFAELAITKPVSLDNVSKSTGVDLNVLNSLNPDYRQKIIIPNKNGTYTLLVPVKLSAPIHTQKQQQPTTQHSVINKT